MRSSRRTSWRFGVLLPGLLALNQTTCMVEDGAISEGITQGITLGVSSLVQTLLLFVAI